MYSIYCWLFYYWFSFGDYIINSLLFNIGSRWESVKSCSWVIVLRYHQEATWWDKWVNEPHRSQHVGVLITNTPTLTPAYHSPPAPGARLLTVLSLITTKRRFHKDNLRHLSRFPDFFVTKRILTTGRIGWRDRWASVMEWSEGKREPSGRARGKYTPGGCTQAPWGYSFAHYFRSSHPQDSPINNQ